MLAATPRAHATRRPIGQGMDMTRTAPSLCLAAVLPLLASQAAAQPAAPDSGQPQQPLPADPSTRAFDLLRTGDLAGAMALLDQALASNPADGSSRLLRATILAKFGHAQEALADGEALVANDALDPDAWTMRGRARLMLGALDGALADADTALRLAPGFAEALQLRGDVLFERMDPAAAVADYMTFLQQVDPRDPEVRGHLAAALRDLGRADEALEALAPALALFPDDLDLLMTEAETLRTLGRFGEAQAAIDHAFAVAPADPRLRFARARLAVADGRLDEAMADLRAMLAAWPGQLQAEDLACVIAARRRDADRAQCRRDQAARTAPLPRDQAQHQALLAGIAMLEGDDAEARRALDAALLLNPRHPIAAWLDGVLRGQGGDDDGARRAFARARMLRPDAALVTEAMFGPALAPGAR